MRYSDKKQALIKKPAYNHQMEYEILSALALFAFVSSITPGPNNLMLMASGANFGFWRTLPHMLGVSIGFMVMVVLVGLGLMRIFDLYPLSHTILKLLSAAYMLYLAWKIANAAPPKQEQSQGVPFTFVQAALFQWVNPKAWAMGLGAISLYAPDKTLGSILWVALVFGLINLPAVSSWTVLGQQMRKALNSHKRLRVFNLLMAGLLLASLVPVLFMTH
ncbi:Transporter, LysE family [hydrothermal vent metagenome]|uniref:Transporter, LysE family n=1 Tax=hydrothermal vent metagenome TaxID=652676 RepID=A0A3B0S4X1_9ZZZZ